MTGKEFQAYAQWLKDNRCECAREIESLNDLREGETLPRFMDYAFKADCSKCHGEGWPKEVPVEGTINNYSGKLRDVIIKRTPDIELKSEKEPGPSKIEIGDVVRVLNKPRSAKPSWYYGKVTGFYEYGLFVQPRTDMEPICFNWKANEITVIKSAQETKDGV